MIKKLVICAVAFSTVTHVEAARYRKRTGTALIKKVTEFCNGIESNYSDVFSLVKTVNNRKSLRTEKRNATRKIIRQSQAIKLKFSFLSNLFGLEENQALKDHAIIGYVQLIDSGVAQARKYTKRLERLIKDANRQAKRKKISQADKGIYEKLLKDAKQYLKKIADLKDNLLDLDEIVRDSDEYRDEKKSYNKTLQSIRLRRDIVNCTNQLIYHSYKK